MQGHQNRKTWRVSLGAVFVLTSVGLTQAADYTIDPAHSNVSFSVRHLVSQVKGRFTKFSGVISYDPEHQDKAKAEATIQVVSINTDEPKRDTHLRSADFFDADKLPTMTFTSTSVTSLAKDHLQASGNLTLHGVTKPVVLDILVAGVAKDPWGGTRAGFTATTKINRKDFGMNWNKVLDNGGLLIGDDVAITIEVEGVLKP